MPRSTRAPATSNRSRRPGRSATSSPSTASCAAARSRRASSREFLVALVTGRRAAAARRGGLPRMQAARHGLRRRSPEASRAWARSRAPAAARSARPTAAAATAASARGNRPTPPRSRSGCRTNGPAREVARLFAGFTAWSGPVPVGHRRRTAARPASTAATRRDRRCMTPTRSTEDSGDFAVDIAGLTRVEGEGSLRLRVQDGVVEEAHLEIFEAPRYFERLVVGPDARRGHRHRRPHLRHLPGRLPDDRGPRLRGRPTASRSTPPIRALRRLLYCGEWIESHALHVYLLHLPDFLGYAERARAGQGPSRGGRVRAGPQEGRQPARRDDRRPGDPPGLGPGRRLLADRSAGARSPRCAAR